jgi:hypothetical protein
MQQQHARLRWLSLLSQVTCYNHCNHCGTMPLLLLLLLRLLQATLVCQYWVRCLQPAQGRWW